MGFPTEQEIYHRLRWDPRFDVQRCSVVIRLRPTGTQRVAYVELDTNVVPWHRIVEFWIDDELVWSRPERIDRLDEIATRLVPNPDGPGLDGRDGPDVSGFDVARAAGTVLETWRGDQFDPLARDSLHVVTWNLLFDRYDAERLRSVERWQDALDRLGALDADVIVLVEVTPAMWRMVLAQPWVQRYMASHAPSVPIADDATQLALEPYGQTILSRFPIADARVLPLANGKRATIAALRLGDLSARTIGVAAIHLTSNRKPDARAIRREQLASLVDIIATMPRDAWLIAGDFNAPPEELALRGVAASTWALFDDAWPCAHPDEPGHTFDVARNELAAAASTTGRSARMDRIHVWGLRTRSCELVGESRGPCGLPPSDHFGVVAELALVRDLATAMTTLHTALAIVPPFEVWGDIQRLRCQDDRNWMKWPPHVTLFHPFVADAWRADALAVLASAARELEPFELVLDRVETIDDRGRIVVLAPHDARALIDLHAAVEAALPVLARERSFRPHLTIGRTGRRVATSARWRVDRLVLLERNQDEVPRYEQVVEIPLGRRTIVRSPNDAVRTSDDSLRTSDDSVRTSDDIVALVRTIANAPVLPFGSSVYAPAHATDLDLLVQGNPDQLTELLRTELELQAAGAGHLRGTIDGVDVDIVISDDARTLAGAADATMLRDHLRAHGRHEAFAAAWREVRRFVRARGLAHNGLGYFSSIGWALLLAVPLMHDDALCRVQPGDAFDAWLRWIATLRPHARIGLDAMRDDDPAQLYLAAPAPPSRNIARHMTPGTTRTFFDEIRRPKLVDLVDEPPAGATITIRGTGRESRGRYEGQALSLVRDLEARIGHVRVWGRFDREPEAATRLGVRDIDAATRRPADDATIRERAADATREHATEDVTWLHRITVPVEQAAYALEVIAVWLADRAVGAEIAEPRPTR